MICIPRKQFGKNSNFRKIRKHRQSGKPEMIRHYLDRRVERQIQSVLEIQASVKRTANESVKKQEVTS